MTAVERRSLRHSQNFLHSPRLVEFLLNIADIGPDDLVCEIGPGRGIITERLARRCRRVVAIEKDPALAAVLRGRFAGLPGIAVHQADFLDSPLPEEPHKVFASIPFNITAAIVTKLTTAPCAPDEACLIMQREAAEKFAGEPRESLGAVLLKPWFEPAIVYRFRRDDFAPAPRVDVVMLRLRKRGPPLLPAADRQRFRDFVTYGFTAHQTLRAAFAPLLGAHRWRRVAGDVGLAPADDPAAARFEQWLILFQLFKLFADARALEAVAGADARLRERQAGLRKLHRTRVHRRSTSR